MIGNHAHASGMRGVVLATQVLETFDNWPQQANLKDIWAIDRCSGNPL